MNVHFPRTAALSASPRIEGERTEVRRFPAAEKPCEDSPRSKPLRAEFAKSPFCFATALGVQRVRMSLSPLRSQFCNDGRLTQLLFKILGSKLFALAVIVAIGVFLLVIPAFTGALRANPAEKLLHQTGEIAIWTLGAVLSLSPLRVLFQRSRLVSALNRHRRAIGVSACVYGLIHFGFHLIYEGDAQAIARSFSKPFIWFGLAGLSILVILTATSNNFSIRKLGGKNWKRLHRLAYAAAALLIYHQAIAGKGHWHIARWLLLSLLALQTARVIKQLVKMRARTSRTVSASQAMTDPV
jgi:methionine sulfoxide reductase heme-binding subunit